jgi:ATP-dependent protease ClpP protease subunit
MRGLVLRALRERAKPKPAFLARLYDRAGYITARECLENGLIDEIVPMTAGGAVGAGPRRPPHETV